MHGSWFGVVAGIATRAWTDLASLDRKHSLSHLLRHLAQTGLAWFRKSFHTFAATTIFWVESFLRARAWVALIMHFRPVFRILASIDVIFDWAALASTRLTSSISNLRPSLTKRHHADTRFSSSFSVLALPAAVFIPLPFVTIRSTIAARPGSIVRGSLTTHYLLIYNNSAMHTNCSFEWRLIFAWFVSSSCISSFFLGWRRPNRWVCCGYPNFKSNSAVWLNFYTLSSFQWPTFRWTTSLIALIVILPLACSCFRIYVCCRNRLLVSTFPFICFRKGLCWICWSFRSFRVGNVGYSCVGCWSETEIDWASCFCSWSESLGSRFFLHCLPLILMLLRLLNNWKCTIFEFFSAIRQFSHLLHHIG